MDTSAEGLLHYMDKSRIDYRDFQEQFGKSEMIIVMITPDRLFQRAFFDKLQKLQKDIEDNVPYIKEINSLLTVRNTYSVGDTLIVEDLLEGYPAKDIDFEKLEQETVDDPLYRNYIISEDGKKTAIVIEIKAQIADQQDIDTIIEGFEDEEQLPNSAPPDQLQYRGITQKDIAQMLTALNQTIDRHRDDDFKISLSGQPVIRDVLNRSTLKDTLYATVLGITVNFLFLGLLFRRISGVALPLSIVLSSLFATFGIMAICGIPYKLTTTVIPSFLLAVGVADSVHILSIFYRKFDAGTPKKEALVYAMGHSGVPVLLTSLTTVAGLLSFLGAELSAIAEMGVFAAIGVTLTLVLTIFALPALIALVPIKVKAVKREGFDAMDKFLLFFARLSAGNPLRIISSSVFLSALALVFILRLDVNHDVVDFFPDHFVAKQDVRAIDHDMKGVVSLEMLVDTHKENGLHEPAVLREIDRISEKLSEYRKGEMYVGKVLSINNIVKETNHALHQNNPEYYRLPDHRPTIAQELLLFENSADDLERIVDSRFSKTRLTIKTPWVDCVAFNKFIHDVDIMAGQVFDPQYEITLTGIVTMMARTIPAALHSMIQSYIIAFIVITILMMILVRNVKIGLLSMGPNLFPILLILGIMGFGGIHLNINTLMIGSIALGLVVDDTIHFIYNYKKYYQTTGDSFEAVKNTFLSTGRAMLITSVILAAGFFTLLSATLKSFINFGFFAGLIIIVALLADFILCPALLVTFVKKRQAVKKPYDNKLLVGQDF